MTVSKLWQKEIAHRKGSFISSVFFIALATAVLSGTQSLTSSYEQQSRTHMADMQEQLDQQISEMKATTYAAMDELGFNVVILPIKQNLGDWYANDYASETMPETYMKRLSALNLVTIEHLIPVLRQKIKWPERKWTVIILGTTDQVVNPSGRQQLKRHSIKSGTVLLGHEIHTGLKIKPGSEVSIMGQSFQVQSCLKESGTKDDITIWMNLNEAQALLKKEGLINEIQALQIHADQGTLPRIRQEIQSILPETQIIEKSTETLARAEAIYSVEQQGLKAITREKETGQDVIASVVRIGWILVPATLLVCIVWITHLLLRNVKNRKMEIGIYRSLGFSSRQLLTLFTGRVLSMSLPGGLLGYSVGVFMGGFMSGTYVFNYGALLVSLLTAVGIAVVAGILPLRAVLQQDPARLLNDVGV